MVDIYLIPNQDELTSVRSGWSYREQGGYETSHRVSIITQVILHHEDLTGRCDVFRTLHAGTGMMETSADSRTIILKVIMVNCDGIITVVTSCSLIRPTVMPTDGRPHGRPHGTHGQEK